MEQNKKIEMNEQVNTEENETEGMKNHFPLASGFTGLIFVASKIMT
jgi:hypothetical protein